MKCIICRENVATIPDRNKLPSKKKRLCKECHGKRLQHDMGVVVKMNKSESCLHDSVEVEE